MLEAALTAGLCSVGVTSRVTGVVPPAVAYLVRVQRRRRRGHLGVSQPDEFNGIKIFAGTDHKLPDEVENEIEAYRQSVRGPQAGHRRMPRGHHRRHPRTTPTTCRSIDGDLSACTSASTAPTAARCCSPFSAVYLTGA